MNLHVVCMSLTSGARLLVEVVLTMAGVGEQRNSVLDCKPDVDYW